MLALDCFDNFDVFVHFAVVAVSTLLDVVPNHRRRIQQNPLIQISIQGAHSPNAQRSPPLILIRQLPS